MNNFNNNNINLYDILKVKYDASIDEIKKAYKKLSLKYHPDKQKTSGLSLEETTKIFIKISEAYEILSDEQKRYKYDKEITKKKFSINNVEKVLYDLKNLFSTKEYVSFLNILDNKFKQTLFNNMQLDNFLIQINKMNFIDIIISINNFKLLDIEIIMNFTLKEQYNNNHKILSYKRTTKDIFEEIIYPIDLTQIYENEGEMFILNNNSNYGNFIVKINIINTSNDNIKYQVLNNDLYAIINNKNIIDEIISFTHLDDNYYEYNINNLKKIDADFGNLYYIDNLGLPYYNTEDEIIDVKINKISRGKLFLLLT